MDKPSDTFRASILKFAEKIARDVPRLVRVKPEDYARHSCCFENVLQKIERDGGGPLFGWYFLSRRSERFGYYLIATNHAIWESPERQPVDVTPFHHELRHQPVNQDKAVLFLLDPNAAPTITPEAIVPLPNRFFPTDNSPAMRTYLRKMAETEKKQVAVIRSSPRPSLYSNNLPR